MELELYLKLALLVYLILPLLYRIYQQYKIQKSLSFIDLLIELYNFLLFHWFCLFSKTEILNKDLAYERCNRMDKQYFCPISFKKFNAKFNETLLICGHRFDTEYLNEYESEYQYQVIKCPLCRNPYLPNNKYKFKYNYFYYQTESYFYLMQ